MKYHILFWSGFDSWVGKIPWRRKWQPAPVSLPGKFHGRRSLAGYSPWGHKESDMTEQFHFHRILVPQPETEPRHMAVKAWSPNHWTEPRTGHTLLSGRSSFNKNMCFYNNLYIDFFICSCIYLFNIFMGLPWWSSASSAGDMGSTYGPRKFHMPWATKPACHNHWSLFAPRAHALQQEKPPQWETHPLPLQSSSCLPQLEKAHTQQWRPSTG